MVQIEENQSNLMVNPNLFGKHNVEQPQDVAKSTFLGRVWTKTVGTLKENLYTVIGLLLLGAGATAIYANREKIKGISFKASSEKKMTSSPTAEKAKEQAKNLPSQDVKEVKLNAGFGQGGNTCYIASVMQGLFATPGFYETYISEGPGAELKQRKNETAAEFKVRSNLDYLYNCSRNGQPVSGGAMNLARKYSCDAGWQGKGNYQEDAQEYCQFLFNVLKVPTFNYYSAMMQDSDRHNEPAVLGRPEGDAATMLPLLPRAGTQINDLLSSELRQTDYQNREGTVLSSMRIAGKDLPSILPVHLERFRGNNSQKTKDPVRFSDPLEIPFAFEERGSALYNLSSVVVHSGQSISSGHYYTYAKELIDGRDCWVKYNDNSVSIETLSTVEKDIRENGYLFFYNNTGVTTEV